MTIEELTARVDAELQRVLAARDMALYKMMAYHLGWEPGPGLEEGTVARQRSHGVACLLACAAAGGDLDVALPAAASMELVENFAQIHDDVQGGHPKRDNRDSVWWVWGPAQAINAGDGMHALARLSLFRLQDRGVSAETVFKAVQLLDQASLDLCEGRFQDLEAQERIDLSVEAYLEMAAGKTGALYSCAMKLGALAASADAPVVDSLGECGAKLGMATQIRDDLRELWGSPDSMPPASEEVLNKKKILPVVYALEQASISEKRRLGEIYFKRVLEPGDVVALRPVLEELGSREYCEELVLRYRQEAEQTLSIPGVSSEGEAALKGFIGSILGP